MTNDQTPTPGPNPEGLRGGERFVYIDETPRSAREIDQMLEGAATSGATFVGLGGERMTLDDADRGMVRRFVAKGEAEPSGHLTHASVEQLGMAERWAAYHAGTAPLKDGETIHGPAGEGKSTMADTDTLRRLLMKTPVVARVERRKAERVAARAERRNAARGE